MRTNKKIFCLNPVLAFCFFYYLAFPILSWASCSGSSPNWTTTADYTSVNTCISKAAEGDTITLNAGGTAIWSSTVTINKALTLNGNGATLTSSGSLTEGFFKITGIFKTTNIIRITGFNFMGTSFSSPARMLFSVNTAVEKLRIDNNTFKLGSTQLEIMGCTGVIDSNYFYNAGAYFILTSAGTRSQADASWANLIPGTVDALFIEDNNFVVDAEGNPNLSGCDAYNGGKLVYRYNEWNYDNEPSGGWSSALGFHGSAAGGCANGYWQQGSNCRRSPSLFEIYNNNLHGKTLSRLFTARGGTGLIYNNTHTNKSGIGNITLIEEEYSITQWYPLRTEWPAEDQVHNLFIWGNTFNGTIQTQSNINADSRIYLGKDYFLHAPCGGLDKYDAYGNLCTHGKATFTGENGASGSYPTDGVVYPNKGTMVFNSTGDNAYLNYTPYEYPHPLRKFIDIPSYPKNLRFY